MSSRNDGRKIRYAVVGLGHIAQNAVLPAFKHAQENSELVGLVSDDPQKVGELAKKYDVSYSWLYEDYDQCLCSGKVDAVYIALPNSMHKEFTVRAAKAHIHVLCEKPMAPNEESCNAMIDAANEGNIKLMIAYRLHFDEANMKVVDLIKAGKIGEPRFFNSSFAMQVKEGNIRTSKDLGGGPLNDMGVYCINAARYIFRAEPTEVVALSTRKKDPRFMEIDEMVGALLRFPGERLATFICSFGAADVSRYEVIGTAGELILDPAYDYSEGLKYILTTEGKREEHQFPVHDQFAPEIMHFSEAILNDTPPYGSAEEGLADVRIICAIKESIKTGTAISVEPVIPHRRPDAQNIKTAPAIHKPPLVKVDSPHS